MAQDPSDFREPHLQRADFVGAFAVLDSAAGILMVQNRRTIGGQEVLTWDLPGGQVEPCELLAEALVRELREETGLVAQGVPEFLFFQEGEKVIGGARAYVWRSFFFRVVQWRGHALAAGEVEQLCWMPHGELASRLTAPYHRSFLDWLREGGRSYGCAWCE